MTMRPPRPGWTVIAGNPDATAVHGDIYMVETSKGEVVRCAAAVFMDGAAEVISFHRLTDNEEVDAIQFVRAIPRPGDDALRFRP